MKLPSYNLADLAPPDIQAYLAEKDIVMVPIASLEQHGPHLPLATDTIQADEITRRAAQRAEVLYTPCVWFGYSPQHMYEPGEGTGTITIRSQILLEVYYDVARSLIHHGFNRLVFVNNHGSNTKIIDPLLRRIRYETGAFVTFSKLYAERYLGLIDPVMENPPEETPGWHSSELETAQVMAHDERLVRMDRAVNQKVKRPDWFPEGLRQARRGTGGGVPGVSVLPLPHRPQRLHAEWGDRQPVQGDGGEGRADVRAVCRASRRGAGGVPEGAGRGAHAGVARAGVTGGL